MDIKSLLSKDADDLEKLTDTALLEYFSPYMKFIRPIKEEEKAAKEQSRQRYDVGKEAQRTLQMAQELLKKFKI